MLQCLFVTVYLQISPDVLEFGLLTLAFWSLRVVPGIDSENEDNWSYLYSDTCPECDFLLRWLRGVKRRRLALHLWMQIFGTPQSSFLHAKKSPVCFRPFSNVPIVSLPSRLSRKTALLCVKDASHFLMQRHRLPVW